MPIIEPQTEKPQRKKRTIKEPKIKPIKTPKIKQIKKLNIEPYIKPNLFIIFDDE